MDFVLDIIRVVIVLLRVLCFFIRVVARIKGIRDLVSEVIRADIVVIRVGTGIWSLGILFWSLFRFYSIN